MKNGKGTKIGWIYQLLFFSWSLAGFFILLNACMWIRAMNPGSPWFVVCLIGCLLEVVPISAFSLMLLSRVFWISEHHWIAGEHVSAHMRRAANVILFVPLPVVAIWLVCMAYSALISYDLITGDENQFAANLQSLAGLEESIVGPFGAGEVFYKWGHECFERRDFDTAEWCWNKSLAEWLSGEPRNDYLPVLEMDDLGELCLAQGRIRDASRYFAHAMSFSSLPVIELNSVTAGQAPYYQAGRSRAAAGLATILMSEGNLREAILLYEKSISSDESVEGPRDETSAGTMAILATLYFKIGDHSKAERYMALVLKYQKRACGLIAGKPGFTDRLSERAQSALISYSQLLAAAGQVKAADELEHELDAIQRAARHELNLSRRAQDEMVEFIVDVTKNIIETKYISPRRVQTVEAQLKGELTDGARRQLNSLRSQPDWRAAPLPPASADIDLSVNQLSMSNRLMTRDAIPVEVIGTAKVKSAAAYGASDAEAGGRFRFRYLVNPGQKGDGHPLVTSLEDASDTLKH